MAKFEIDEVAIYCGNGANFPVGTEVKIISTEFSCPILLELGYESIAEGGRFHIPTRCLRKKKPRENPDVLETQGKVYDSTLTPWQPPKIEVEQ